MATRSSWSNGSSSPLTLDRRALLRQAAAFGIVLPAGLSRHARADDEPLVRRRTYVGYPDYESVRTSHDGRNLAYLAPVDGVMNLWLAPVSAPQSGRPPTRVTDRNLGGVPVTSITFADEGHGFARPENRLACDAVIEAFLAAHLGGRHQPVGSDFSGSTIKIETGAELIPGLG